MTIATAEFEAPTTSQLLRAVREAGQDFEWYPTTERMINTVAARMKRSTNFDSILDIGAGDGRVLTGLADRCSGKRPKLFGIEKSQALIQAQPEEVTPIGTEFFEQNLTCLPVDILFCNPPYSEFELWVERIVESGFAKKAYLIIPQRWKDSRGIAAALKKRGAKATTFASDDFHDAERQARAVVDLVEISFPRDEWNEKPQDPFDTWFDQNIDTFDKQQPIDEDKAGTDLARINQLDSIEAMVEAFNEEYARLEENYRAIFRLDMAILKELNVSKNQVRDGIKLKMAGLKNKYWESLFTRLEVVTKRLSTATKKRFLEKITSQTSVAFTVANAYAVVLWAIKHANKYFDEQLVALFRALSTHEGVLNYKSNQKTWQKNDWRYVAEDHSHYTLDYRIVLHHYTAIRPNDAYSGYDFCGNLHRTCHEQIDDIRAVMFNLGFAEISNVPSRIRTWESNDWQDFHVIRDSDIQVLFQVKAFKNGNLHFRFLPDAIKALNVEAARLLGWIQSTDDVVREMGYTAAEARTYYGSSQRILPSNVKLLAATTGQL